MDFQSSAKAPSEGVVTLMKLFGYKDQTQGSFGGTLEGLFSPFRGMTRLTRLYGGDRLPQTSPEVSLLRFGDRSALVHSVVGVGT